MKWNPRLFHTRMPESVSTERLRRFIEGDLSPEEKAKVRDRLLNSEAWRREYERVESLVSTLRRLPSISPPPRVWERIAREIKTLEPEPVWFPWFYRYSGWVKTAGIACGILVACLIGMHSPYWDPGYKVIEVTDDSNFGLEAEAYIAHHDLSKESPLTRESLVAFYTMKAAVPNE